jgi:hypothetical protein
LDSRGYLGQSGKVTAGVVEHPIVTRRVLCESRETFDVAGCGQHALVAGHQIPRSVDGPITVAVGVGPSVQSFPVFCEVGRADEFFGRDFQGLMGE